MRKILLIIPLLILVACTPVEPASPQGQQPDPSPTETEMIETDPTLTPEPTEPTADAAGPMAPTEAAADEPETKDWPEAFLPVRKYAAENLKVNEDQVLFVSAEEATFRDSCLDAPSAGENCLQVITPGFRVTILTPQGELIYHMNTNGRAVQRALPGVPSGDLVNPDA